jgi:nucleotide-binding universal stress UspA family protein
MLKSILVGLDASEYSNAAIELGYRWASQFNCLLVGLGVIDAGSAGGALPPLLPQARAAYEELVVDTRRRIEHQIEQFSLRASQARIASKVLEDAGYPADQICLEAQRYDLVMLGQQTFFHPGLEGRSCDTLQKVLRSAPRPVVVVPRTLGEGSGVLVGYDGGLQAARTLQMFVSLGLGAIGPVHVVAVDPESSLTASRAADRAVEYLRLHGIAANAHGIESVEAPGSVLVHEATRHGVSLLVMGAHGQPTFKELLLGSATITAVQNSPVPLFLYH